MKLANELRCGLPQEEIAVDTPWGPVRVVMSLRGSELFKVLRLSRSDGARHTMGQPCMHVANGCGRMLPWGGARHGIGLLLPCGTVRLAWIDGGEQRRLPTRLADALPSHPSPFQASPDWAECGTVARAAAGRAPGGEAPAPEAVAAAALQALAEGLEDGSISLGAQYLF